MSPTDSSASALLEEIAELTRTIQAATRGRADALNEWAAVVCPLKVGDETTGCGYTFAGKRVRVTRVQGALRYDAKPTVRIAACVLKHDGSESANRTEWYWGAE